jgi:hypothetical protein
VEASKKDPLGSVFVGVSKTPREAISSEVLLTPKLREVSPVFKNILYNKGVFCVLVNEWQYPDVQGMPSGYDAYGRGGWDKRNGSLWLDGGVGGSSSGHPAFVHDNFYWAVSYSKTFSFQGKQFPGVVYVSGKNIQSEDRVKREVVPILKGVYGRLPANGTAQFRQFRKALAAQVSSSRQLAASSAVLATLGVLRGYEQDNRELYRLLHAPVDEFPRYRYLASKGVGKAVRGKGASLYGIIYETLKIPEFHSFFSVDGGGRVSGFYAYRQDSENIFDIKTFSLVDEGKFNKTLADDLLNLVFENVSRYSIQWKAFFDNPAKELYDRVLYWFDLVGPVRDSGGGKGSLLYRIPAGSVKKNSGRRPSGWKPSEVDSGRGYDAALEVGSCSSSSPVSGGGEGIRCLDVSLSREDTSFSPSSSRGNLLGSDGAMVLPDGGEGLAGWENKEKENKALCHSGWKPAIVGGCGDTILEADSFLYFTPFGELGASIRYLDASFSRQGVRVLLGEDSVLVPNVDQKGGFENNAEVIWSATAQELLNANDNPNFYHRANHLEKTKEAGLPELVRTYANSLEYRVKSEHFSKNQTYYRVFVLLKDFIHIAKDKKIPLEEAVDYSLHMGDVSVRCSCPSFKFHGFSYMGTQLGYLYGVPRENRFPKIRNPTLQNATCKHSHLVLEQMLKDNEKIVKMFSEYYKRLPDVPKNQMIAIPAPKADEVSEASEVEEDWETGDVEVTLGKKETQVSVEPEVISEEDPLDPEKVKVDTRLAEEGLPEDQRPRYVDGGEGDGVDGSGTSGGPPAGDSVSTEDVMELETEIEEAGKPRNDNERYSTDWAFQGLRRV